MKFVRLYILLFICLIFQRVSAQVTVNVPAGGDVAGASLQVLSAGGGTINLAPGNYYITGSIVLGSNTTINGAGGPGSATQSVIYAPASPNAISMVTQAYPGASNLTISNLVLDGNIPQAAMLYGTGNGNYAYNDDGILIYSQSNTTVGVTITNVEVRHTLRGILTGLVNNLTISGCYFHDNNPGGFSHNMYLVATSGVEIDHTRSVNALLGDGLHIDFGGTGYTIRKSEFTGNNGLGLLSQQDNNVTVQDTKFDFNTNEGIQIDAGGLLLTRDETSYNGGYGLQIPDTADGAGLVYGFYSYQNDPLNSGGDFGPNYVYQAAQVDYTEYHPGPNAYPAIQADGVLGIADTGDWTLNYGGYTYLGAVDFNANHLSNGSITFQVGNAVATGQYPLNIRYSNGTSGNQTMNISVNGGTAMPVTFPSTGSYTTWATVTVNAMLNMGNNTVTLSVPTGATSAPELDLLTVTAAQPPAPNAPTSVTAVANGPYSVTLNWTPPANSNSNAAQTYNIYKNNTVPIVATKITGTTWTDTRIFYGETTNSYFVTAVNQGGESGASNTVTVTTGIDAPPGLQVSVTPRTPANNLNWLGVSGAANYVVRRSTVSGGPFQSIATVPATTGFPSYSDTSLAVGTNYFYVVAAVDSSGNISANSYQVEALSETFTLSASASSVNLSSITPDTISVVGINGFNDAVNFAVSGLPTGVTASLSAASGSSTQITFTANTSATIGSYPVTITGTDGGLTSSVGVTVVISSGMLAQTITFNPIPQQSVGNSLTVMATASSGLPVSFFVVPNGNCSISGNVVTFLNGGACGVVATQAGNATFRAAANVGQVVQVGAPNAQTITFAAIGPQTAGTTIALIATASSGLAVSFASATPAVCSVSGSSALLLTTGTCTIVASQAGGGIYGPATSVAQSFTVVSSVKSQTITFAPVSPVTYGIAPILLNGTASSGLAVSYSVTSGPGALNGNTLTVTGAGTIVIVANQAGNSSYSAATQVTASIVVNKATPTITWATPSAITYGTTLSSTQLNAVATSVAGSTLAGTFTYTPVSGTTPAVGSDTLSVSFVPTDTTDYTSPVTATTTLTVNPASQSIAFTPPSSVTYGVSPINLTATGGSSGNPVTFTLVSGPGSLNGSTLTVTGAGTIVVAANQAGNSSYSAATQVTASIVVSPASQTITFNTIPAQTVNTTLNLNGYATASSGLAVTWTYVNNGNCTISGTIVSFLNTGACGIIANQAGNANYSAAAAVGQVVLVNNPQPQTITFAPATPVTYGVAPISLTATGGASGNPVTFTLVSGPGSLSGSTLTVTGAGTIVIAANQAASSNGKYSAAAQVTASIAVNKATPIITWATPAAITYGTALSSTQLNAVATSVAGSTLAGTFTYAPLAGTIPAAGSDTLSVSFVPTDTADYNSPVTATTTLTVNQASQTITFAPPSAVTYGVSPIALTATGGASGNAITFTVVSGPGTLSGSTLTVTGAGTIVVAANQAGNSSYSAAAQAITSIVVNKAAPTLIWATPSAISYGTALSSTQLNAAATGVGGTTLAGTFTYNPLTGTTPAVGSDTLSVSFVPTDTTDYTSPVTATTTLTVNQSGQTITFAPASPVSYGVSPITLTASGGASGNPVTFTVVSGPGSLSGSTLTVTGAGTIVVAANQAGNSSYAAATQVSANIVVNPASQTISFSTISGQTAGGTLSLTATASSGLAVSFASSTPSVCTASGSTATLLAGGTCSIVASQAGNSNYSAAPSITQSFTVAPAGSFTLSLSSSTVTLQPNNGVADALTVNPLNGFTGSVTLSLSGFPAGVSGSFYPSNPTTSSTNLVVYVPSGTAPGSYPLTITGVSGSLTVSTPATLVVQGTQTITFAAIAGQTVGGSLTLNATASSGLAVTYSSSTPSVCTVSGSTVTLIATGTCTVTAAQPGNTVYTAATPVTQSFTVAAKVQSQTITFNTIATQTSGTSLALTATASSGLTVTFTSSTTSVCTVSGSTASLLTGGTCTITASQAGNSTYSAATPVSQSFTVLQSQTITFNTIATQHVGTPLNLNGYATASSGLPITWTLVNNGNCSISGTTVTFINSGACGIIANQAGNSTYAAAAAVGQVVQVAAALQSQTITFKTIPTQRVGTTLNVSSYATASSGLTVTFTVVNNGNCSISGTTVTFLGTSTCGIIANQAGNSTYAAAAAVGQVVQVSN